jgi:hypothetical protein
MIVKRMLFISAMALLAGVISEVTALLLSSVADIEIPYCTKISIPVFIGVSVALGIEGALRREKLEDILLRKIIPAIIGMTITFYFICMVKV